jgi:hypothetical protein
MPFFLLSSGTYVGSPRRFVADALCGGCDVPNAKAIPVCLVELPPNARAVIAPPTAPRPVFMRRAVRSLRPAAPDDPFLEF